MRLKLQLKAAESSRLSTAAQVALDTKHKAKLMSTVTLALRAAHQHIHQLTAVPSGPDEMVKIISDFLSTRHKAHVTFEQ